jgi:RNA polymerase sigma-70 factor (ECF subfamily)
MGGPETEENRLQSAAHSPSPPEAPPLDALFRDHHRRVYHAAYRITGDEQDAEDVLQSVFLRLLRRPVGLDPAADPGPYLQRAAVNAALDLLRGRKRSPAVELGEVAERLADEAGPGPERVQRGRELRSALRGALARLTPETAEIFALRYFEGHDNREIATLVGLAPTTVAVRLHRARRKLQAELATQTGGL